METGPGPMPAATARMAVGLELGEVESAASSARLFANIVADKKQRASSRSEGRHAARPKARRGGRGPLRMVGSSAMSSSSVRAWPSSGRRSTRSRLSRDSGCPWPNHPSALAKRAPARSALMTAPLVMPEVITGLSLLVVNGVFWYGPFWWHWGVIVVALMLIVLMTRDIAGPTWFVTPLLWQTIAWWAVLAAQILALFGAPGDALWGSQPLSGSKEAARVVTQYCPSGCAVITDDDVVATGVSAYLGGQSLYHVNSSRWASFTRWDPGLVAQRPPTWGLVQAALLEKGPGSIAVLSLLRTPPDGFDVLEEPIEAVLAEETFLVVRLAK